MSSLGLRFNPPIAPWERVLSDFYGVEYRFTAYWLNDAKVYGVNAVYALADDRGFVYYIGRAQILSNRMSAEHEKLRPAIGLGANQVWVHVPTFLDSVDYIEAEKRLIERFCPPLNVQHNWYLPQLGMRLGR